MLQAVIDALASLPVRALVTLGPSIEPGELDGVRAVPVHEGQREGEEDRAEREDGKAEEVRGDEGIGHQRLAPVAAPGGPHPRGGIV